ncbi:hypothetical protein C7974DRAFT_451532 [Boeremia exigua]|uniref:uncharacterized protein n=1 Tax=Boeremia exigua TaxID=749465 RepID=UPI001E8DC653|nr:uncharacterized protein C7974DRAFT_451532 [Boeremia exigua]KAH6638235.1 hypothetical protein C7974DRAFT_451532 [Boeremia exigua]
MAPRKPATPAKVAKKSLASPNNRIVKRPARGYHKYKNGLLNVTPKGGEMNIVKNNQDTPLLRLPPEIRNRIWEHTLGRSSFRAQVSKQGRKNVATMVSLSDEPGVGVALLRSCRQIYSEAAMMPICLNTFVIRDYWRNMKAFRLFSAHQFKRITMIRLELQFPIFYLDALEIQPLFPAMNDIEIVIHSANSVTNSVTNSVSFEDAAAAIRVYYQPFMESGAITMTIKRLDQSITA